MKAEPDSGKALKGMSDVVAEVVELPELIAKVINLMVKKGQVTGKMVENAFGLLNLATGIKRAFDAYQQLKNLPDPVTATITLAPTVVEWPERYRVFEINASFQTNILFQNAGSEVWLPQDYELLVLSELFPVARFPLAQHVAVGQPSQWNIPQRAPSVPGIYHLTYQIVHRGVPIGPPVPGEIVVVPEKSSDLQSLINAMIEEARRKAGERFDEYRQDLERRLMQAILAEIEHRLREICGGTGAMLFLGSGVAWWGERRRKRHAI
jgi:hypothetical protein